VAHNLGSDAWHLATWLDKSQTDDNVHLIKSIRQLATDEYEKARAAISDLHQLTTREAYVYVVAKQLEYAEYQNSILEAIETESLHALQNAALEYGRGLRYRFLDWLLSVKAFLDLTEAQLRRRYGQGSAEFGRFKAATAAEYDSSFSYRFIYRLRNFAQHSAFPPLDGRIRGEVDEETDEARRWLELYLNRDKLLEQWSEWGPLKQELDALPQEIPVDEHMASAMDSITRVAAAIREIDFPILKRAAEIINALWDEARQQPGSPLIGKFNPETPSELLSWVWLFHVRVGEESEAGRNAGAGRS
jgi:hypothetical protein